MEDRARLKQLLVERSVRLGEFTLASGARSSYYVDARRTSMSAEGQYLIGKMGRTAVREHDLRPSHVGGLTMGADPIAYAIAHRSFIDGAPVDAFSVRKKPKEHGTGQRIEGGLPSDAHCLMVEDAMTTGGSTLGAIDAVEEHGAVVVGVLTLVDRSESAADLFEERGIPLISLFRGSELLEAARTHPTT
ncbi:MAG: orotate phosphoribosyltransferase [Gemmatimonadota bacterium]|nr:orotate phosphoribosyltransferase [Gemmatimonadota bacterium]